MRKIVVFVVMLILSGMISCSEVENAVFKDVKGIYKGTSKEYLNITINISEQNKDSLKGSIKFEVNPAKIPEGETLVKYLPDKESDFTGEIVLNKVVLTTTEYTVKVNETDVPIKIVFNLTRSEDGTRLTGNMTFSGISDLGEIPIDVTKQ